MENNEKFDGLFLTALQQSNGLDNFFDSFFGCLFRKTDFFTQSKYPSFNPPLATSKNVVDTYYNKYLNKYSDKLEKEKKKKVEEKPKTEIIQPTVREITPEEALRLKQAELTKSAEPKVVNSQPNEIKPDSEPSKELTETEDNSGKSAPLKGNGGRTERYMWTQPLIEEVNIIIPIEKHLRGKDFNITNDSKKIKVQIKGGETIIDGEFCNPINVN